MRVSKEAAVASRARIVAAASRLLRERGIEATSIADVMAAAGLTHGGFYRHFGSKDDLVAAALGAAFAGHAERFAERRAAQGAQDALRAYVEEYLSPEHVARPDRGCPVAALGAEAGRGSAEVCAAFARGVEETIARFVSAAPPGTDAAAARAAAIRRLATMVGAVIVARGVGPGALGEEVLAACAETRERAPTP